MQPLVSIIVPVYKVEDYLRRCLDSLRRQSLFNIEIIIVNDASPDRCGVICEEYAAKDTRFKVFHFNTNQGLSVARNFGITNATADYLMFVDSDDYVHLDFCKEAYECAVSYQADLVLFRYQQIDKDGKPAVVPYPEYAKGSGYKTHREALNLILHNVVWDSAWNKLYRKELFQNISYPSGYLYEDTGTTHKLVWQASCIYYLDKVLYYHCYREGSIMTLRTNKVTQDRFAMHFVRLQDLWAWGYPSEELEQRLLDLTLWYCTKMKPDVLDYQYVYSADVLRRYKFCVQNKEQNKTLDLDWEKKIMLLFFNYWPSLFEWICKLKGLKVK